MPSADIKPFRLTVADQEVQRLNTKLRDTPAPTNDVVPDAGNDSGIPSKWAREMYDYWRDHFAWKTAEAHINSFDHFTAEIEALNIHFVHQQAQHKDAIPLLMVHEWPGSFYEFSEITLLLTNPPAGPQAFHVIAPSIPGFCFSSPPPRRGWIMKDTTRLFHTLMMRLGYEQYAVQAGDWGQFVARELGANPAYAGKHCKFVHLNYCPGSFDPELNDEDLTGREKACRAKGVDWRTRHVGYAVLMRTRPQTVGWMLED
ncbi:alpha/beta-hydrolase, partial [Teratosphaeria nubilosa]